MRARQTGVALLSVVAASLCGGAQASASGPALDVPPSALAASLHCSGALAGSAHEPVLLVPGTATTTKTDFSWNYEPALTAAGVPWCAVDPPASQLGDIQVGAEYIVAAVRSMFAAAGQRIAIVGHSQGGMQPRWALRFWPDTRAMVQDLIGLAPSNHGTIDANVICLPGCAPGIWQQRSDSAFLRALNAPQETFPGIDYTVVYSHTDEVVVPNFDETGSSALHGPGAIANVAIQSICPLDLDEHLAIGTYDPVSYALVTDAITHPGPADPARVDRSVCGSLVMPGVNLLAFPFNEANLALGIATALATTPTVPREPALKCYAAGSC